MLTDPWNHPRVFRTVKGVGQTLNPFALEQRTSLYQPSFPLSTSEIVELFLGLLRPVGGYLNPSFNANLYIQFLKSSQLEKVNPEINSKEFGSLSDPSDSLSMIDCYLRQMEHAILIALLEQIIPVLEASDLLFKVCIDEDLDSNKTLANVSVVIEIYADLKHTNTCYKLRIHPLVRKIKKAICYHSFEQYITRYFYGCVFAAGLKKKNNKLDALINEELRHIQVEGLEDKQCESIMLCWKDGKIQIIIGTNAFGMGINSSNVSLVIHCISLLSITSLVQQIGQAKRDGNEAKSIIFYSIKKDSRTNFGILAENREITQTMTDQEREQKYYLDENYPSCLKCDNCKNRTKHKPTYENCIDDVFHLLEIIDEKSAKDDWILAEYLASSSR
ncbi:hypothetical protein C1645_834488 [Glomus cerebriforme]|uniref:DNA 3'-5' helicase n=1 Tax=Glomus cerebriforme TaxID=658196 RepID=A0A397S9F4_9GLOM|nr:hypothetical protein C1645_834488 [Glomus cerebriforme]